MKTVNLVITNTLDEIIHQLHDKSQEEDHPIYWELYKNVLEVARGAGWNYIVYEGYYMMAKHEYEKKVSK